MDEGAVAKSLTFQGLVGVLVMLPITYGANQPSIVNKVALLDSSGFLKLEDNSFDRGTLLFDRGTHLFVGRILCPLRFFLIC